MGGTSGVPTADPAAAPQASQMSVSPMAALSTAPPTGAADTGITPGTPGNPGVDFSKLPAWAEGLDKDSVQSIFSSLNSGVTPANSGVSAGTTENLGFPSAQPTVAAGSAVSGAANTGFTHADYPTVAAPVEHVAGAAPPPAAAAPPVAAAPAANPDDYVFVYKPPSWGSNGLPATEFGTNNVNQKAWDDYNYYGVYGQAGAHDLTTLNYGYDPNVNGGTWNNPSSPSMKGYYGYNEPITKYKPGDVLTAGDTSVPRMKKSLYDFNMAAYGNPYGPDVAQRNQDMFNKSIFDMVALNQGGGGG